MNSVNYQHIGFIYTPFDTLEGMPIQPAASKGVKGRIELLPEFCEGLTHLDGFSHIILLYHLHRSEGYSLMVTPFLDDQPHGVFATRAPRRPNPMGISTVKLAGINGNILHIENIDMLNGTPLLDIKPYVPFFDAAEDIRTGWLQSAGAHVGQAVSDRRFQ